MAKRGSLYRAPSAPRRGTRGLTPPAATPPALASDPRRLARQLKRVAAVVATVVFGGFWALAAGHPVGVTNASSGTQTVATPAAQVRQVTRATSTSQPSSQSSRPARRSLSNGGSSVPVLSSGSS